MRPVRIAFFTAGTTGAGHVVRGLAIERALQRAGAHHDYALFAPRVPLRLPARDCIRTVTIDHRELVGRARAAESELAQALREYAPDVLVVDLFWAPLRNILPLPACEAWLLVRSVPHEWFIGPPGHPYERSLFDRVIAIEPGAGLGHEHETIDPIVIANPDEMRPKGALRAALGLREGERLSVLSQVGKPGELAKLADLREPQHAFTFPGADGELPNDLPTGVRVHDGTAFFPLAEWLDDADAIVSGAGYNAFWESHWLGYADRARFVPFARTIDDTTWRMRTCTGHVPLANGADEIARRLR